MDLSQNGHILVKSLHLERWSGGQRRLQSHECSSVHVETSRLSIAPNRSVALQDFFSTCTNMPEQNSTRRQQWSGNSVVNDWERLRASPVEWCRSSNDNLFRCCGHYFCL